MTISQAKKLMKLLNAAVELCESTRDTSEWTYELEKLQKSVKGRMSLEVCPSCHEILRSWHSHKDDCKRK